MSLRSLALGAALLGGVCCVLAMFVDVGALTWAGTVLVVAAAAAGGATLAGPVPALRLVAGVGAAVLVLSVWAVARDAADDRVVDGVIGGLAALAVFVAALRGPRPRRAVGESTTVRAG